MPEVLGSSSPQVALAADWPSLAHRELVSRIVISPTFAKSERLCSLLTYVCDMALKGRDSEINEQKIGHAVFGRSLDYDSSIDGIVRTQASRLRQRLDLYFQHEGVDEPVRIVIPRGSYVPIFESRPIAEPPQMPELQPAASAPLAPMAPPLEMLSDRQHPGSNMALWALCGVLALALAAILLRDYTRRDTSASRIAAHPLWGQMFSSKYPTLEVPGDSGLVMYHNFDDRDISLNQYLLGDYRSAKANSVMHSSASEWPNVQVEVATRRYTSIVDLEAAATLAQIAQSAHSTMQVRYARDLRPNDLKAGNVILIGAFEANPWVELFERNMNFSLHNNRKAHVFSVLNRSPNAGEPTHWESAGNDPQRRVYGLVAFMPNISRDGNALIVEGTSMAGTEAAWDFVSDDTELLPFLKRIKRPDGTIPHFELLLETQNMSSSAVHSNLLAWRITN
ncbi:hypothetical protein FTO74_18445 [Granulicella sp. WH15]|uniref:hypothetical protein n=1 Tax=Granulicella sp. WH15 TaxID=2602070 RepID=UPI001366FBBC|nr:hypothetical protein [Granulicella sp. WH15]QHN05104.1 hypothetical protein FTO74_18445 [Granulicella sp. WH15]